MLTSTSNRRSHRDVIVLGIILVFTYGLTSSKIGFFSDDFALNSIMLDKPFLGMFSSTGDFFYSQGRFLPMFQSYLALNWFMWGANPLPYHLVVCFLHFLNVVLLYHVLQAIFASRSYSFVTACLFLVYPCRDLALFWYTGSGAILVTTLFLLSLAAAVRHLRESDYRFLSLSVACWCMSVFTYESSLPLVILILLLFHFRKPHSGKKGINKESILYVVPVLIYMGIKAVYLPRGSLYHVGFGFWKENLLEPWITLLGPGLANYVGNGLRSLYGMESLGWILSFSLASTLLLIFYYYKSSLFVDNNIFVLLRTAPMVSIIAVLSGYLTFVAVDVYYHNNYHLYLPSIGVSMLLAVVVCTLRFVTMKKNPTWGIVLSALVGIAWSIMSLSNIGVAKSYIDNSELLSSIESQLKEQIPDPKAGSVFIITNLPATYTSDYFKSFGYHMKHAMRIWYSDASLSADSNFRPDANGFNWGSNFKDRFVYDRLLLFQYDNGEIRKVDTLIIEDFNDRKVVITPQAYEATRTVVRSSILRTYYSSFTLDSTLLSAPGVKRCSVVFEDKLELVGFQIKRDEVEKNALRVKLFWRALSRLPVNYLTVFQVRGTPIFSHAQVATGGTYPPTQWKPGEFVGEQFKVMIPWNEDPIDSLVTRFTVWNPLKATQLTIRAVDRGFTLTNGVFADRKWKMNAFD